MVSKTCNSPYENDPRRPGCKTAESWYDESAFGSKEDQFKHLPLLASAFDSPSLIDDNATAVTTYHNGFVDGLIHAFNQDLHLVIRPDDVWQAILSQFGHFVNGNAERLRSFFVAHEGKKTLTVDLAPLAFENIDLGAVAQEFVTVIQNNVVDPELKTWMTPNFSTTTDHDRATAAFCIMGALQQYFEYGPRFGCGLPSVTLLGERSDWAELASRIERLPRYGDECGKWADLLRVVVKKFLLTFDAPDSKQVHDFWMRVAHRAGREGSMEGLTTLSGWITAFAYFGEKGAVINDYTDVQHPGMKEFYDQVERKPLVLDGVKFPLIRPASIPRSVIVLPMTLRDMSKGVDRFSTVISGTIGMAMSKNETTAQPLSGWWVVQEFERPIEMLTMKAESSVTGSTTDGRSESYSVSEKSSSSNNREVDEEFDDEALP